MGRDSGVLIFRIWWQLQLDFWSVGLMDQKSEQGFDLMHTLRHEESASSKKFEKQHSWSSFHKYFWPFWKTLISKKDRQVFRALTISYFEYEIERNCRDGEDSVCWPMFVRMSVSSSISQKIENSRCSKNLSIFCIKQYFLKRSKELESLSPVATKNATTCPDPKICCRDNSPQTWFML